LERKYGIDAWVSRGWRVGGRVAYFIRCVWRSCDVFGEVELHDLDRGSTAVGMGVKEMKLYMVVKF
jgi:hypothetical protein